MMGRAPPLRAYARRMTALAGSRTGAPDRPPASFASGCSKGRAMVVLVAMSPASPHARATSTTSSTASGVRSGAIFRNSGLPGATCSSRAFTARSSAVSCLGLLQLAQARRVGRAGVDDHVVARAAASASTQAT